MFEKEVKKRDKGDVEESFDNRINESTEYNQRQIRLALT